MNTDCSQILDSLKMTGGTDQLVLKEINPAYSVDGLMLKLQFSGHLMRRADSSKMTLMLGKVKGKRRTGQQGMRYLDGNTD